ncbi:hypothetical protein GUITHDRAFT_166724 [Guillardia theta CCMP2712]|uniref:Uncharacterized protein n=1 Tax=Guillardia theta (strain CCMP2712) TaxID=905079 RepID=L1I926_GUITC|nr:hypothetical protein GUITHDRAFT_166724 [Guillardia theta CCMP2712]EKX32335.1 hypothetical protein GUITHDRAFT_166724 [Guillardia theta CCMP2712]|eukprot:XP_005819315.1 hypothetical protein GUITHDRAFT_166724 [Guillardia theta CCMP2712]
MEEGQGVSLISCQVMILVPVLGTLSAIIAAFTTLTGLTAVPPLINLSMAIWGIMLWSSMGDACMEFFEKRFWHLALLFKITVVLLAITLFTFFCIICVGAAFLGGTVATGGILPSMRGYSAISGDRAGETPSERDESLLEGAREGDSEAVEKLLRGNANLNVRDENGFQALHLAASRGHLAIVRQLIKAGANIDAETSAGDTPLSLSAGHVEVEQFLRSVGAKERNASEAEKV